MSKYKAPALEKGLDILEYLSITAIPQTQNEISQGLNKSPNEIYRMLACLEERQYISKSISGQYSLTLKLFQLAHSHSPVDGLVSASKHFMDDLAYETKQSCHLGILQNNKLLIVAQTKSPNPVALSIEEGSFFPLLKTTSGKVLLAYLDKGSRDQILKRIDEYNNLSSNEKESLELEFDNIRSAGSEIKSSELTIGVTDIAVPILGIGEKIIGVLAISSLAPISENETDNDALVKALMGTAEKINRALR